MLMFSLYPLVFSLFALILLLQNLCCTRDYTNVHVWHRHSLFLQVQVIIFSCCTLTSYSRLINSLHDGYADYFSAEEVLHIIEPVFVVMILMVIKMACVWNQNQRAWLAIACLSIVQYITIAMDEQPKMKHSRIQWYYLFPSMLSILVIDLYYLYISCFKLYLPELIKQDRS